MLSIAYRGIGIPLFWAVLNLEGNSCAEDRIALLQRVIKRLGEKRIETLLADREFIGTEWFHFLIAQEIPFLIRGKKKFHGGVWKPWQIQDREVAQITVTEKNH